MQGVPVSEALFNFVNAWSLMFLPLILSDSKRKRVDRKVAWWTGFMVRPYYANDPSHEIPGFALQILQA